MTRGNYSTKQREKILEVIKELDTDFDINDIYNKLNQEIGLTTIYRYLDELYNDNKIKKLTSKKKVIYHYLEECDHDNHFYLKCNKCGKMKHVDCDCINEFISVVKKNHDFFVDNKNIVIEGICLECHNKELKV